MNLTFYPGPSKIYPQVEKYLTEAYQSGLLSTNHRSAPFMELVEHTISLLHTQLDIPEEYEIYFTSSATEAWEIVAQSLVVTQSHHLFNGAFGQKWWEYTERLRPGATSQEFSVDELLPVTPTEDWSHAEVLCITQNETSNGTQVKDAVLADLRRQYRGLIAVDATSSMAGISLPWSAADIWFASVQKCFGLPSGMGVMVVSPKVVEAAEKIGERSHYNSLLFIRDNFQKFQTPYTPNILAIFLLNRVLQSIEPIGPISTSIKYRAADWYNFLGKEPWDLLVSNPEVRSDTVITLKSTPENVQLIKSRASAEGISLGNGYGAWKSSTLRIANFPAHTDHDFQTLKNFLLRVSAS